MDPGKLLEEFRLYDRAVDVVSAYHWLFTETDGLPSTVDHFERYPRIPHGDGRVATPDFTVLFADGTGIVAEIANIALHENSVEKLCKQLDRYSRLTSLPSSQGELQPVEILDVLFLSPMETAAAAVDRVLRKRADHPEHSFKPVRRPVIVQFVNTFDKYIFQFWPDASVNGKLHVGERTPNYASFAEGLNIAPRRFADNKVRHAFMNDPIPALYMATRLWSSILPSGFGGGSTEFVVSGGQITDLVREQYGYGSQNDVRAGMQVLVAAGIAAAEGSNSWKVRRRILKDGKDGVHLAIANSVGSAGKSGQRVPRRAFVDVMTGQGSLLDELLSSES